MSFCFGLSSDEEEEDLEEWNRREHREETAAAALAAVAMPQGLENDFDKPLPSDSDDDDDESIEWEDAEEEEEDDDDDANHDQSPDEEEEDRKPAAVATPTLQPVTVHLGRDDLQDKEPPRKKRKVRRKFRHDSLPRHLQQLLRNLHRTHLLTLTSQALRLSELTDDVLAVALSLGPDEIFSSTVNQYSNGSVTTIPSLKELQSFCDWYFDLTHQAHLRRQARIRANRRAGAPVVRRARGRQQATTAAIAPVTDLANIPERLQAYAAYLANSVADDPQYHDDKIVATNNLIQNLLLLAMVRAAGGRARWVWVMDPVATELDVNHPLLSTSRNIFQTLAQGRKKKATGTPNLQQETTSTPNTYQSLGWVEVLCHDTRNKDHPMRWIHVDPAHQWFNQPDQVEGLLKKEGTRQAVLAYAVAVEHSVQGVKLTDVTPRYAHSFVATLRRRGLLRGRNAKAHFSTEKLRRTWWGQTIQTLNQAFHEAPAAARPSSGNTEQDAIVVDSSSEKDDEEEDHFEKAEQAEKEELKKSALNEAIPTSKAAFRTHPVYVIQSVLGNAEVLAPDASKRMCGVFKGQVVYRRSDVSTAYPARKWPYLGRKVRATEIDKPVKRVKARKKPASQTFRPLQSYGVGASNDGSEARRQRDIADASQPLEDGTMERLYAVWQTDPWSPPRIGPMDPIPVNEYRNVELDLLNPGLVHINKRGIAKVAKKLGIPYAPCMMGFEGQGGRRVPTVRGIVVHVHNEQLVREAGAEMKSYLREQETTNRRKLVYGRWKKLLTGLLTKDRLEREYGNE